MKKEVEIELNKILKEYECFDIEDLDWEGMGYCIDFSEDFIKEFQDRMNWRDISRFQKFSENFIKEFKDKLDWYWIAHCQDLSEDFIYDFRGRLDIDYLIEHNKIAKERLSELREINSIHSRFEILDIR